MDGAKKDPAGGKQYVVSDECWMGKIDKKDPNKIEWSKLPAHPGPGRIGIVAGGSDHEHRILFSGGATGLHNYKFQDADGKARRNFARHLRIRPARQSLGDNAEDTYDVRADGRGIVFTPLGPVILGGTLKNSAVSARVLVLPKK